jgi:hypothetical protein
VEAARDETVSQRAQMTNQERNNPKEKESLETRADARSARHLREKREEQRVTRKMTGSQCL